MAGARAGKKTAKSSALKARRARLAAAVVSGKRITAVAKQEAISRSHLSREANSPETRLLIRELLAAHQVQVGRIVAKALTAIEDGFKAVRILPARDADGDSVTLDGGTDHYARLTAAKRVLELLEAAKPKEEQLFPTNTVTWEGFVALYRQRTTAA